LFFLMLPILKKQPPTRAIEKPLDLVSNEKVDAAGVADPELASRAAVLKHELEHQGKLLQMEIDKSKNVKAQSETSTRTPSSEEAPSSPPIKGVQLELVRILQRQHENEKVDGVAFSDDGLLASAWQQVEISGKTTVKFLGNGSIRLWDASGKLVRSLQGPAEEMSLNQTWSVAISPDNSLVAASTNVNGPSVIWLWETTTGTLLRTLTAPKGLRRVIFSPDGRLVAAACDDGAVHLWTTATGLPIPSLTYPSSYILSSVAFSPDGHTLASVGFGWKNSIRLWNEAPPSWKLEQILRGGPPGYTEAVAFSPDGVTLATGHASGDLLLWDFKRHTIVRSMRHDGAKYGVTTVAFSPDGHLLASTGGSELRLWDPGSGKLLTRVDISEKNAPMSAYAGFVAFHPRGGLLATTFSGDVIRVWKLRLS